jgi:hypothetical protein
MVDEKHPFAIWQAPHHFHAVMVNFNFLSLPIDAADQPLRAAKREIASA